MKYASIVPPCLEAPELELAFGLTANLSSYQMVLGQWVVNSPEYRDNVRRLHDRGDFILVDNGAAEPAEERVAFPKIVEWALPIVDEIALPDVLRNSHDTIEATVSLASLVPPRMRLIIPQGETLDEWYGCLDNLDYQLGGQYRTIGVPKHLERHTAGRMQALRYLVQNGYTDNHDVHLLGSWRNVKTEIQLARLEYPQVRGIDTGLAAAAAQIGCELKGVDEDRTPLDNFFQPDLWLFEKNIKAIQEWCNR